MADPRLYKRGRIYWTWFILSDGTRKSISTRCRDRKAALIRAAELEREIAQAGGKAPTKEPDSDGLTLFRALRLLLEHQESSDRSPATIRASTYHCQHLLQHIAPETQLATVTFATTTAYVSARLTEGAHKHTIRKEVGALAQACRRAAKLGLYVPRHDPSSLIPDELAGAYRPKERWLTKSELAKLLARLSPTRRDYVLVVSNLGLRAGELYAIQPGDYDPAKRDLIVRGSKTAKSNRTLPVNDTVHEIFTRRQTFPEWGKSRRDLHAACARAKIPPAGLHDLRRTFATQLSHEGVQERTVADLLGHTTTVLIRSTYASAPAHKQMRAATHLLQSPSIASLETPKT